MRSGELLHDALDLWVGRPSPTSMESRSSGERRCLEEPPSGDRGPLAAELAGGRPGEAVGSSRDGRSPPAPGAVLGAPDHGPVPIGPPGGRACDLPAPTTDPRRELGIEPSAPLRQLEHKVLSRTPTSPHLDSPGPICLRTATSPRRCVRGATAASGSGRRPSSGLPLPARAGTVALRCSGSALRRPDRRGRGGERVITTARSGRMAWPVGGDGRHRHRRRGLLGQFG
jgi:hypothetical protein